MEFIIRKGNDSYLFGGRVDEPDVDILHLSDTWNRDTKLSFSLMYKYLMLPSSHLINCSLKHSDFKMNYLYP